MPLHKKKFLAQETLKKHIVATLWTAQYSHAVINIQKTYFRTTLTQT